MGTRADFYTGVGKDAKWLGSIAWDGYPSGISGHVDLNITDAALWESAVASMLDKRNDGTKPEMGWPWPWDDSQTTDYAYAFSDGRVIASCFGGEWFDPKSPEPDDTSSGKVEFPDMKDRKAITLGKRSGLMFFETKR